MIVVWLQDALDDRRENLLYIAEKDPLAAIDQGERIEKQIDGLVAFPEKGRPGRKKGTRELVIQGTSFIALYRIKPRLKRVEIFRLLHGAQQWPGLRE